MIDTERIIVSVVESLSYGDKSSGVAQGISGWRSPASCSLDNTCILVVCRISWKTYIEEHIRAGGFVWLVRVASRGILNIW